MEEISVYSCQVIEISKINNRAGNISVVEGIKDLPFKPRRIFYIYDIPAGELRGAHAHKECHQLIIAASGSFEIFLDDGKNKKTVTLNRPFLGLHIPPGIWANEQNFSSGAICLVLTSHLFSEKDYIRDYPSYLKYLNLE